jgi:hypothetical protein
MSEPFKYQESYLYDASLPGRLATWIGENAIVDSDRGTVSYPHIEERIHPQIFKPAMTILGARVINGLPNDLKPTIVFGGSEVGNAYASAASELLNIPYSVTARIEEGKIEKETDSKVFESGDGRTLISSVPHEVGTTIDTLVIRGMGKSDIAAVFYGVCKSGRTAEVIAKGLKELGIESYHIFLVAEDMARNGEQSGYRRLKELGISATTLALIKGINEGKLVVTPEDI